jgi:steroid 5-alpha reductase family enzyme
MNEVTNILLCNLMMLMACMVALWLISIPLKDVSFVDSFWAIGFLFVALMTYNMTGGETDRRLLILVITAVWSLRLGSYLFLRWRREGPDGRYVALLKRSGGNIHVASLTKVFLLQGPILWIVSLPVQLGMIQAEPADLGVLAYVGIALAVIGFFFESVGDYQMTRFKADPSNHGKVMDKGLWAYTRHPNYFGDACVFWGLYLIAAETSLGMWSFMGPLLLNWTLVKWSGAALLERRLKVSRPGYVEYLERTSSFIPWPPRRGRNSGDSA